MLQSLRKDPMDEDLEKCDGDYFPCEFCGDPYPVEFIMRHQVSIRHYYQHYQYALTYTLLLLHSTTYYTVRYHSRFCVRVGHVVETIIFSLYHVIVRPAKIIKGDDKNWAHFQKIKHFKNQKFHINISWVSQSNDGFHQVLLWFMANSHIKS